MYGHVELVAHRGPEGRAFLSFVASKLGGPLNVLSGDFCLSESLRAPYIEILPRPFLLRGQRRTAASAEEARGQFEVLVLTCDVWQDILWVIE